jgi:hypothetical protein
MRYSTLAVVALLVACAAVASAQTPNWLITELYRTPVDCGKPERVYSYYAYRNDFCFAQDGVVGGNPAYSKYTCASDGYTMVNCYDSACTNCTTAAPKVAFDSCKSTSGDYYSTRCGAFPAGAEGLSIVAYTDNSTSNNESSPPSVSSV